MIGCLCGGEGLIRREKDKIDANSNKCKKGKSSIIKRIIKRSSKRFKRLVLCILCILLLLLGGISYSSGIANPLVGLRGIWLMTNGNRKIHKLSESPLVYVCNSFSDFVLQMESELYKVIDEGDRHFELRRGGEIITMESRDFLGFYEMIREVDRK